ncbi:MAG: enolase C-terminal domain-like protein, partial [Streptosporangiaceae bacterium]
MKITAIRLDRMRLPLDPPFHAAWDGAQAALAAKSAGFRAVKIRIGRTEPGINLDTVRATRAAVGEDFTIMADLNQWWRMPGDTSPALDQNSVLRIAAELADLGVFWLEEPLPAGDLAGMRALRAQVRVAGGEMARTPAELLAALDADALDVLQPDVVLAVGMARTRTLGELAL